ncbi:hypothetical protein BIV03_00970 [Curtobacterium sp. MCBA15_016]|uniref:hypothetical protein n=1 Tax=Curtobacterium sp. MCBA15_016 TaxID=1898740 RepID=UPI0008DD4E62|nr:hypothetical protein [Curtobacterium sp. MCBA15_016]OII28855.1 hypothetical protein BIV03_00970 [Curtobacterium sp. MCBA15_016]
MPFNLPVILKGIGRTGEILLWRGWEVESIDAYGAGFLRPPSFVNEDDEYEDMEMLWSTLTVEYTLGGYPVLTEYPPLSLADVLTESDRLQAIEAYRWPASVPNGAVPGGPSRA